MATMDGPSFFRKRGPRQDVVFNIYLCRGPEYRGGAAHLVQLYEKGSQNASDAILLHRGEGISELSSTLACVDLRLGLVGKTSTRRKVASWVYSVLSDPECHASARIGTALYSLSMQISVEKSVVEDFRVTFPRDWTFTDLAKPSELPWSATNSERALKEEHLALARQTLAGWNPPAPKRRE